MRFACPRCFIPPPVSATGIIADLAADAVRDETSAVSPSSSANHVPKVRRNTTGFLLRHAQKVARLANHIFHDLQSVHHLPPQSGGLLEAAAYLHDVGHFVSDTRHHKHSYYLVANSDMPGFNLAERGLIANLCRYHRKNMPAPEHESFQALSAEEQNTITKLTPMLRLADSLDRSNGQKVQLVECLVQEREIVANLHAHSAAGLELEIWAASRLDPLFRQVYGKKLTIERARS